MKDLKANLRFFGITHKEVAEKVGISQPSVTQLLNEDLVRKVQLGAEALIDEKVGASQKYQNDRLADIKSKINPISN
jgi:DNA-binding Lrp family transcriptional regulator